MLLFKGTIDLKLHVILYSQRNLIVNQETDTLYQMARMILLFFGNTMHGLWCFCYSSDSKHFICMQNYRLDKSQIFTDFDFDHCRT